jgi:hypothetical protein
MWIYEYGKLDESGFLPSAPYGNPEDASRAMKDHEDRFGTKVQGPKQINELEIQVGVCRDQS